MIFRRTTFDAESDATVSSLWRVADDAAAAFTGGTNDRMPRVSADGTQLAFVRDMDETTRLCAMALAGGEARPVGDACERITSLAWSPDGDSLAYTAAAGFDAATAHVYLDEKSGARHIRALPYKGDLDGLHDGRRAQLFVVDVADGTTRRLTSGDADMGAATWSPDGRTIACSMSAAAEASMRSDIVLVDVASGTTRTLTARDGPNGVPSFSPGGGQIAWIGHRHGNDTRYSAELFVARTDGTEQRSLSLALDRPAVNTINGDLRSGGATAPQWCSDDEIVALVSDGGNASLRSFNALTGEVGLLAGGEREISAFSLAANGCMAIAYATPVVPSAIALVSASGERCLTDLNPWLAEKTVVLPRHLPVYASDGTALDAWLIAPPQQDGPLPLVLEIHGGPHATYGNTFFFEFQILAACGFAVAYGNPRGSEAYGFRFASAITGAWGGIDAADLLSILDAVVITGDVDASRVASVGGSYGGFMTTWLLGHTDRFATGVSMRSCNDFVSFTGASDIGYFLEAELGLGLDAKAMRELFDRSPMRAVENISVPMLIVHSERDYRCPIDQGEQLFNTLRMLGKSDAEFVRFTGDGHELSRSGKPRHRVLRLRAIARWLLRHIGGNAGESDNAAGALFRPLENEPAY